MGKSASKTPWHLFLSIKVFQMFMISIIYLLALVACLHAKNLLYMLYFYAIASAWWIVCWPRKGAFLKLQGELGQTEFQRP